MPNSLLETSKNFKIAVFWDMILCNLVDWYSILVKYTASIIRVGV